MKAELEKAIATTIKDVFNQKIDVELTRPDEQFGDYSTNVALQLAKQLDTLPPEIAKKLITALKSNSKLPIDDVTMAGPGFINIVLSNQALWKQTEGAPHQSFKGKTIVVEYSDPNPFKVLHVGHLYTSIVGDAIASLLQVAGARVHKVNFGGDVGLHVGKTMWAILQELGGQHPEKLKTIPNDEQADWLTTAYVAGSQAYDNNSDAREAIETLNKKIYHIHAVKDKTSDLAKIYWETRQWSYDYFEAFYKQIGTKFERYYPESETAPLGLQTVQDQLGPVFEKSDGAIVFKAEKYGLHTRVFITKDGLPTYEAKDVGLIMKKWQDYHFDRSIVITGNEIIQYMQVVLKAIEQFAPELAAATTHLTHGMVRMAGGQKMSSRKGNILRATDVLTDVGAATKTLHGKDDSDSALGAIKYAFIKQRLGGDIIFDVQESVSIEGNSGPYLQYAHARARSILSKAHVQPQPATTLDPAERRLLRKISEYTEVVDEAVQGLAPHHIATYLYELAQNFNQFYETNRVIGDKRQASRLALVTEYANVLKQGLTHLNIPAPEHM